VELNARVQAYEEHRLRIWFIPNKKATHPKRLFSIINITGDFLYAYLAYIGQHIPTIFRFIFIFIFFK